MTINTGLDLSEFVSKLIQDTFNAITISSKEQAEVYYELKRLTDLDFDSFREKYILQSDVETKLLEMFPLQDASEDLHCINVGLPYQYNIQTKEEFPALQNDLDYISSNDQKKLKLLTEETVNEVYKAVKDLLAQQQYNAFQDIMSRGIPRVMVDSGRILAKISLNYSVTEETEESKASVTEANSEISREDAVYKTNIASSSKAKYLQEQLLRRDLTAKLSRTRVGVTIPNATTETSTTNSSLWGEIEIKFKSVD